MIISEKKNLICQLLSILNNILFQFLDMANKYKYFQQKPAPQQIIILLLTILLSSPTKLKPNIFLFIKGIISPQFLMRQIINQKTYQKIIMSDSIQIVKTDGEILCQYKANQHLSNLLIRKVIMAVVQHSRKLYIEAYDNDIIQLIEEGCYVYYRNYRSVIIIVISCCSYDYHQAEQLMPSLMKVFDRFLDDVLHWRKLPKYISKSDLDQLTPMGQEIKHLVAEDSTSHHSIESIEEHANRSFKIIQELDHHSEKHARLLSKNTLEHMLDEAYIHKRSAKQIFWIMKSKQYALIMLLIANFMVLVYFFASYELSL